MARVYARPDIRNWPLDLRDPTSAVKFFIAMAVFCACAASAQTPQSPHPPQLLAITFDDLPAHGAHPPAISRMQIIQSIVATLRREKLPPTYGFINGVRTEESPETLDVL